MPCQRPCFFREDHIGCRPHIATKSPQHASQGLGALTGPGRQPTQVGMDGHVADRITTNLCYLRRVLAAVTEAIWRYSGQEPHPVASGEWYADRM